MSIKLNVNEKEQTGIEGIINSVFGFGVDDNFGKWFYRDWIQTSVERFDSVGDFGAWARHLGIKREGQTWRMTPQRVDTLKAIRAIVWLLRSEIDVDPVDPDDLVAMGFQTSPLPYPPKNRPKNRFGEIPEEDS